MTGQQNVHDTSITECLDVIMDFDQRKIGETRKCE